MVTAIAKRCQENAIVNWVGKETNRAQRTAATVCNAMLQMASTGLLQTHAVGRINAVARLGTPALSALLRHAMN